MTKEPLKVVVRLLPPEITEDELLGTINESHVQRTKWRFFVPGKRYKGEAKPSLNSRCYFQFEALEYAEDFIKEYHGHQFVDGQGEQFRAVVCFAPYQKAPRAKAQKDPRDGTIADDPTYKEFVESLAEASKTPYEAPPDPKAGLRPADPGDTPLLKFMQTRAKERRARAEKKAKRWREMESIVEDPKKAKWRCAECGTSKHLEEDPDDRGTFYCTYCWESWESQQAPAPKVKKKKKKSKEAEEGEAQEEAEEVVVKKKKKKKDRDREADEEAAPKSEWRAKDKSGQGGEEDDGEKRRRRKKDKYREKEEGEEEEEGGKSNRWRVKKTEAAAEGYEDWDTDKRRSKAKGSRKASQDDWWEEDTSQKTSSKRPEKKSESAADDSRGSRWRAKAPAAEEAAVEEEKPRQKHKERKGEGGEGGKWRPKT